jgi:hypothetical protein
MTEKKSPKSSQDSSEALSLEKSTQESMLSEQGKKHTSLMDIASQSKIQKVECKQLVPSYPSAFKPAAVPYPFNMYPYHSNHSLFANNTPQIQNACIPNSNYQVPIQLIANSQSSNIGYHQYVTNSLHMSDGNNAQVFNNLYQIPPNTPQISQHTYFTNPNSYIQNHNISYQIPPNTPQNTSMLNGYNLTQQNGYSQNPNMCCQTPYTSNLNHETDTSQTLNSNAQDYIGYSNSQNTNGNNEITINAPKITCNKAESRSNNSKVINSKTDVKPTKYVDLKPTNDNSQVLTCNSESQSSMKSISQDNIENVTMQRNQKSPITPNNKPVADNSLTPTTPMFDNSGGVNLNFCSLCSTMLSPHDNIFAHMLHNHN